MNRREFLKRCYQIGGYAGIAGLGLGAIEDARGWGILPAVISSTSLNYAWINWNGSLEGGMGDTVFCAFEEASGIGDDETGQGIFTGLNLVLTSNGSVAAAVGGTRNFPAQTGQYWTQTAADHIFATGKWTIIWKLKNFAFNHSGNEFLFALSGANDVITADAVASTMRLYFKSAGSVIVNYVGTTDNITNSAADMWWAVWSDGSTIRWGFTATRPVKWSNFESTKRVSVTTSQTKLSALTNQYVIFYVSNTFHTADFYYFIASNSVLIDNGN